MANSPRITATVANVMLNNGVGTPLNSGYIRIYDGTQPPNGGDPITTQNLIVTLTFATTAFPPASGGVLTANPITSGTAVFSSTATWARFLQSDGTTTILDCSVGTSGTDIVLSSVTISSGGTVSLTSLTITQPLHA